MKTGRIAVGHPVDVASGTQFTAWEDIEIPGLVPLFWRRYYSTAQREMTHGILGRGWLAYFDMTLTRDLDGFRFSGPDGESVEFDDPHGEVDKGGSVLSPGDSMELRREGEAYAIYHWHGWEDDVSKFVFRIWQDGTILLDSLDLPSGHGLALCYNDHRRLVEVHQKIEMRRLLVEYDNTGLMTRLWLASPVRDPELVARYVYDSKRRLTEVWDGTGKAQRYTYDDNDRLIEETTRINGFYRMKYDSQGRCIEVGGANGYDKRIFEYKPETRTTTVIDSLGNQTLYFWNERGQVVASVLPNGARHAVKFDEFGRIIAEVGPLGAATRTEYEEHGNVASIISALGAETRFKYNEYHQPTRIQQGEDAWTLHYERGAVVSVIDPLGVVTTCERDDNNLLCRIHTPSGNTIHLEHSPDWTQETCRDDMGLVYRKVLDHRLNVLELHNARGLVRKFSWGRAGRLNAVTEIGGGTRRFERDAEGQIVRYIDELGHSTQIEYSQYSDIIRVTNASGHSLRYEWDTEGRVVRIHNPKGEKGELQYDSQGNVIQQEYFDGRVEEMEYDLACRMTKKRKPDGTVLEYDYDSGGNLLVIRSGNKDLVKYAYDAFGQMIEGTTDGTTSRFEYDQCGRVKTVEQNGLKLDYRYHQEGDVAQRTFQGAMSGPLSFDYDKRGRLVSLRLDRATLERYEYDNTDLLIRREMALSVESFEYDFSQRKQKQRVFDPHNSLIVLREFRFDEAENLVLISDSLRGTSEYHYDATEQLVKSTNSRRGTNVYVYDENGNLLKRSDGQAMVYGRGNRLLQVGTATYEYDPNGNLVLIRRGPQITQLVWDELDQLVGVNLPDGKVLRYSYDALGRRVWKDDAGSKTDFYWAGDDLLCEHEGSEVVDYAVAEFMPYIIWRNGRPFHVITAFGSAPHELLDEEGRLAWRGVYDDWGLLVEESTLGLCSLRLAGQYADRESRLHYNRFRFYDPEVGRFVSADPYGWYLPDGLNEYLYAPNPINWEDPLGLTCGKKKHQNSVYVLTKGQPPPGKVVYVGITKRSPKERLREHSRSKKGQFDNMYVIDQGLTRRQARNLEGSALHHVYQGSIQQIPRTSLINNRTQNGKGRYTHSYTSNPGRGRQLLSATDVTNKLTPNPANLVK